MEPAQLSAEDFFKRWRQIGGPPREAQKVVGLNGGRATGVDAAFTKEMAGRCGFGVLEGVDPNKKNVVGAAVLHTSSGGKFGCLVRVEPNYDTMVCGVLFLNLLLGCSALGCVFVGFSLRLAGMSGELY